MVDYRKLPDAAVTFGKLLKRYRQIKGWGQDQVAYAAWKSRERKTHISAYEKGKKGVPDVGTISQLKEVLNIPQREIDKCFGWSKDVDLPEVLIENLAVRFGHDNPSSSVKSLYNFLRDKAADYETLQKRFLQANADEHDERRLKLEQARGAIKIGEFERADKSLAKAEEAQIDRTLDQIKVLSETRALRGEAALFNGNPEKAHSHFKSAAEIYEQIQVREGAARRHEFVQIFREHFQKFGGEVLKFAIELAEDGLKKCSSDTFEYAVLKNDLGSALASQGYRTDGQEGLAIYDCALRAHDSALKVFRRSEYPIEWALTLQKIGNVHWRMGYQTSGTASERSLDAALSAFREALKEREKDEHPCSWAETQNSLGYANASLAERSEDQTAVDLYHKAIESYREALCIWIERCNVEKSAGVQNNLAVTMVELGECLGVDAPLELFSEAADLIKTALKTYTRENAPKQWARLNNNLGTALSQIAARTESRTKQRLFQESFEAFEAALEERTRNENPSQWAMTKMCYVNALRLKAEMLNPPHNVEMLRNALSLLEEALSLNSTEHGSFYRKKCLEARKDIKLALKAH